MKTKTDPTSVQKRIPPNSSVVRHRQIEATHSEDAFLSSMLELLEPEYASMKHQHSIA